MHRTCHASKYVIDTSPTLEKSLSFAIDVTDKDIDDNFTWSWMLKPLCMSWMYEGFRWDRFIFTLDFSQAQSFERQRATKSFRRIRVCEKPQMIGMAWYYEKTASSAQNLSPTECLSLPAGETLTFEEIFDAMARGVKGDRRVEKVKMVLWESPRKARNVGMLIDPDPAYTGYRSLI